MLYYIKYMSTDIKLKTLFLPVHRFTVKIERSSSLKGQVPSSLLTSSTANKPAKVYTKDYKFEEDTVSMKVRIILMRQ